MILEKWDWSGVWLPDGNIIRRCQLALTGCHPDMSQCCPVSLTPAITHNSHTHHIPLRPSLTRHSSMPRRPIRGCLMRHSVTHLKMHDKVLLDFPVATVCSLLMLLNMHVHTQTCFHIWWRIHVKGCYFSRWWKDMSWINWLWVHLQLIEIEGKKYKTR